ncbi:daptide-type RiPP biosynthesis methyltransferase [Nonomuraea sp. NPDC049784]|uniref:daptide-type RiPP biosynthesis methyltransferase n=1 Tax=Nonomuraea sp. NPDC049784 TaxID=3154361 RepID=UPI0033D6DEAF
MTSLDAPTLARGAADLLAELGNRAEVHDLYSAAGAAVYHDMAGADTQEVRELVALVRGLPGPVLDLAAGSGRLTLPLLALGREVTALDLSESLLALLRERLAQSRGRLAERCTPVHADMRDFALDQRFGAIVLGTSSISLLDAAGRAALYRGVRAHLLPQGRFLLTTVELHAPPGQEEAEFAFTGPSGRSYRFFERWAPLDGRRVVAIFPAETETEQLTVCTTTIGVLPADLLESELTEHGFAVRSRISLGDQTGRHRDVLMEAEVAA